MCFHAWVESKKTVLQLPYFSGIAVLEFSLEDVTPVAHCLIRFPYPLKGSTT
jgi:hypothetical protein